MGLDMYLTKRHYVKNWDHMRPDQRHNITIHLGDKPVDHIKPERISYIIEQVAYWRKANQIHKWFVDHVQGGTDECQESSVETEQLTELLATVEKVLADRKLAAELLPTESGFFFGGTEYDEYYWHDLTDTQKQLTAILSEPEGDGFYYQASW